MDELLRLLGIRGAPSSLTLFQRSIEPVMQGRPQFLPELQVTAPAPTPTVAGALRRAQMVDEEASRNPEAARLREEQLREAMARIEGLKGAVSDVAMAPLTFALGGGATAGQLAENVGGLTGLESVERAGRAVREGAQESLGIVGQTGLANAPYVAGAIVANFLPYLAVSKIAPWQAAGGLTALAGRALTSAPVDLVQAAQQEGSTAQMLAGATENVAPGVSGVLERASASLPGRFAVEALTNVLPDVAMEYALPAIRRGAQAAADVNTDILASRRGAIDLGGGAEGAVPDVPKPPMPDEPLPTIDADGKVQYPDTRGRGVQYHGSTSRELVLKPGVQGSDLNYYGTDFYTSDAMDVTGGYSNKARRRGGEAGAVYRVTPTRELNLLDMEQPIPDWFGQELTRIVADSPSYGDVVALALDEKPSNLRELYDNIRDYSANEGLTTSDVQELFDGFREMYLNRGYDGLRHIGGLRTKRPPHEVKIYFNPADDLRIERVDPVPAPAAMAMDLGPDEATLARMRARDAEDAAGVAPPEPPRTPPAAPPSPEGMPGPTPTPTAGLETPTVMRPEVDEYFNVPRFGLDDVAGDVRLRQTVTRMMEQPGFTPKTVVTWDETRKMAEEIGLSVNDIDRKKAARLNGAEMLAIRNLVGANTKQQSAIAARLADGLLPQAEREMLENTFKALDVQQQSLLDKFGIARRQTARDFNSLKIAGNLKNDPFYWLVKAKSILGDERFGMLDAGRRAEIVKLANDGDMTGLYNLLDKERRTSPSNLAKQYYQATLLYNPATYSVNATGNITMAALETMKDAPAAVGDYLMSLVTKQRSVAAPTLRQLKASTQGAKQGVREAMQVIRGIPLQEAVQRFEFQEGARTGSAILDAYINGPFRVLSATDRIFRGAALRGSLANQAEVLAKAEGLKGQALADRVVALTGTPSDEMIVQAISDAEEAVFQDRTAIGRVLSGIQQAPVVGALVAPFTKTPGAIATRVFEYSPLGLAYSGGRMAKAMTQAMRGTKIPVAVQRQIAKELGRGALGTPLVLAGYWMAKEGKIVPTTDSGDRAQRDTNRLLGTIEGAVRFDDALLNITRITPAANLLAMGAAIYQKAQQAGQQGPTEFLGSAGGALLRSVADLPFFTGIEQVQRAVEDPGEFGGTYLRNVARSATPFSSLLGAATRATDPVIRAPETVVETLMSNIPGLSQRVPGRVGQFGAPVERPLQGFLNQMFLPMPVAENRIASDPVLRAIDESGATLGLPQKAKDETEAQFRARMQEEGPVLRSRIVELIQSEEYQRAGSKANRARLIGKVVSQTRGNLTKLRKAESAREAADAFNATNVGVQIRPETPRFQPPAPPAFRPGAGTFAPPQIPFQPTRP